VQKQHVHAEVDAPCRSLRTGERFSFCFPYCHVCCVLCCLRRGIGHSTLVGHFTPATTPTEYQISNEHARPHNPGPERALGHLTTHFSASSVDRLVARCGREQQWMASLETLERHVSELDDRESAAHNVHQKCVDHCTKPSHLVTTEEEEIKQRTKQRAHRNTRKVTTRRRPHAHGTIFPRSAKSTLPSVAMKLANRLLETCRAKHSRGDPVTARRRHRQQPTKKAARDCVCRTRRQRHPHNKRCQKGNAVCARCRTNKRPSSPDSNQTKEPRSKQHTVPTCNKT